MVLLSVVSVTRGQPWSENIHSIYLTSSNHSHRIISHHHKSEQRTVRYFKTTFTIFITAYCYNCSILLFIIVVNLLLRQIYKLSFIIGMHV